jgi:hypothetical protein
MILASFLGVEQIYRSIDSANVDNKESRITEMPLKYLYSI